MSWLVDTNILLRLIEPTHPMHPQAAGALRLLLAQEPLVSTLPQNVAELWNVCTRPLDKNGLGFSPADTDTAVSKLEAIIKVIPDDPAIYPLWRKLIVTHAVSGVQVHDTRIAAAMQVHGLTHLITFNVRDFKRFPQITAVKPEELLHPPTP
jgi:predicted nucleic acid-binding protein